MNRGSNDDAARALEALEVASHLSVVSGTPDEAELAALVAGIAAAVASQISAGVTNSPDDAPASYARGAWVNRAHHARVLRPGAGAWRWASR